MVVEGSCSSDIVTEIIRFVRHFNTMISYLPHSNLCCKPSQNLRSAPGRSGKASFRTTTFLLVDNEERETIDFRNCNQRLLDF